MAGFCDAAKCHPFLLIVSPTSKILTPEPPFALKATTDFRGCQGCNVLVFWFRCRV